MRLPMLLLACAALSITAAQAQDAPPAEQQSEAAKSEPAKTEPGLSDLSSTVETLQDTPPAAEAPVETPSETPAEPPAEAPAQSADTPPETTPTPTPVPDGPRYVPPLTRAELDQLAATAARGRLLGAIAQSGLIATRDMLSRISDPDAAGVTGWLAEPEGNGVTVTFYAAPVGDAAPGIVYRANILGGRVVSRDIFPPEGRPLLNPRQARMAAARTIAATQGHRPCGGDQFNYFVVPPPANDAPVEVYQISPQAARGRYPLGGHFRTAVAADGSVAETRGFTNACVDVEAPDVPAGQRPAPLAVTHLLDPLPTELHVFLSIWTQRPLVVIAGDPQRLFQVTPQGIAEVPREAGR